MLYFTQERNAQIGFHLDYNFDTPFGRTHALDFRKPGYLWHGVGLKMISEVPVR